MTRLPQSNPKPKFSRQTLRFEAIGTSWVIDFWANPTQGKTIETLLLKRIVAFDVTYSRFRDDSWVSQMRVAAGKYTLPADVLPLLDMYDKLFKLTAGALTPLIGSVLEEAGYDAHYSLQKKELHTPPEWNDAVRYDTTTLSIYQPLVLDFGAAGKGYLLDLLADVLVTQGIFHYCLDASGDLLIATAEPLRIGLEHPDDSTRILGVATLTNGSLCASAANRRSWQDVHHIIDARSLQPVNSIKATWVYAQTGLEADALATALFFVQPGILTRDFRFEYAILTADNTLSYSKHFPAEIF